MRSCIATVLLGWYLIRITEAVSVRENYTICNWARLRAGVVRDALYLDGGLLWWQTAFADGTAPVVSSDGNVAGDMFRLNLSIPFDTKTTNISARFDRMSKAGGAGNNIAPNYVDGTMFTNDGELYLYGGLPRLTDAASAQSADAVLGYEAYQYGPDRQSWSPGFYQGSLPDGVTRYITNGAGVSAPSENLGFYFSGMRSANWGPIYYDDSSANETANTLIQVDMSTMRGEKWTNTTLPDNIPPRANAELVWIPVSKQGVLVAIGGVAAPEEIWATGLNATQTSESKSESPGFMTTLPVYDIASQTWYLQNTTGEAPGQLTEFCSVVAPSKDSSSFNVYVYGGYDGLNAEDLPSDDVWILSIPAFTWVKAYTGHQSHGRSGHRCVMPYPDQMFVIGGIHQNQAMCVEGGIIQVFNLNTLQFQDTYDPNNWSNYEVPAIVTRAIGRNAQGSSAQTASWSDHALASIFSQKYSRQIAQYYPYKSDGDSSKKGGSGVSKGAIIGISVAAALIFLLTLVLLFLLIRRRRIIRSGGSEKSASSSNSRVSRWLNGASCANAHDAGSKHDSSVSPPEVQQVSYSAADHQPTPPLQPHRHEMASTERPKPPFELATPYNKDDHPRHSGVVGYAYNPNYGHTYSNTNTNTNSNSNSNSNSSGPYQPSPLTSLNEVPNNAGASPLRTVRYPPPAHGVPDDDLSSYSHHSSTGTHETPPWPLPASQNTWRHNHHQNAGRNYRHDRANGSDTSSVQPIIQELEGSRHLDPGAPRGDDGGGSGNPYHHRNESASSGVGTLPSPSNARHEGSSTLLDEEQRRSLFDTISPVSPTLGRHRRF
ncbi:hypothetical protein HRR83_003085 [Exophiala dermatitidis]|uniref:Kelch repeat-containing protein n=1 Tax=Exophiala dermatitidis TaxID=5970 RepID=A0AAN6EMX0_EXODE|nr:hypothetical protein HRR73_008170 [Exophiala dermatitidis]KAJ4506953.1 hypothetical protein HRR74_008269 [Exophiala dermatitidis]KAJ4547955.1 hypothetical protein HRR76_000575 [Exophiala dermatitidis]KAJ4553896.1 hypothetical protein HRR77_002265 [Exophiala dermatitidis]KAJ4578221.1 hypothetical protein HRR79_001537 [Exophiala dermatitidis]